MANELNPDVVFIGGGPIGLYTAIQLKARNPKIEVLVIEERLERTRHQKLKVDLTQIHNKQILKKLRECKQATQEGKDTLYIPIKNLEDILLQHAMGKGIKIENRKADPESIEGEYPRCKVFIGTDGPKSSSRHYMLNAQQQEEEKEKESIYKTDSTITREHAQCMLHFKFEVLGKIKPLSSPFKRKTETGFICNEYLNYNDHKNTTEVILEFIVDEETYLKLKDIATFRNPLRLTEVDHLDKFTDDLQHAIRTWVNARIKEVSDANSQNKKEESKLEIQEIQVTKIPLSIYCSNAFTKTNKNASWFLVGDAAFGLPALALNAGIKSGNKLTTVLTEHFKTSKGQPVKPKLTESYGRFLRKQYVNEKSDAKIRNIFIAIGKWFYWVIKQVLYSNTQSKSSGPKFFKSAQGADSELAHGHSQASKKQR